MFTLDVVYFIFSYSARLCCCRCYTVSKHEKAGYFIQIWNLQKDNVIAPFEIKKQLKKLLELKFGLETRNLWN